MVKKIAVFLDRDGVLNIPKIVKNRSYAPLKFKEFRFYPKVKKNCNLLKKYFLLIIVTNQPDVKRGKIKISELNKMHKKLHDEIKYDDLYYCKSLNKKSKFRKPNPGMLLKAINKYNINLSKSYLIGDRWSDIEAGNKVGCKTIFIDRNYKEKKPNKFDFKVKSFSMAAKFILHDKN
jgi:D-glycero-D-manno-heptose 1,7-bisphosphate phosphatase